MPPYQAPPALAQGPGGRGGEWTGQKPRGGGCQTPGEGIGSTGRILTSRVSLVPERSSSANEPRPLRWMMACLTQLVCSALAVSAAVLVWQWRDAVDIESNLYIYIVVVFMLTLIAPAVCRVLPRQEGHRDWRLQGHRAQPGPPVGAARSQVSRRTDAPGPGEARSRRVLRCRVVIAARSEQQLAEVEEACLQWSGQVVSVVADVSREEDCRAIVDKARAEFGGLDILILNAALQPAAVWFTDYPDPVSSQGRGQGAGSFIVAVFCSSGGAVLSDLQVSVPFGRPITCHHCHCTRPGPTCSRGCGWSRKPCHCSMPAVAPSCLSLQEEPVGLAR